LATCYDEREKIEMAFNIQTIKEAVRQGCVYFSAHAEEARMDDDLTASAVLEAIRNDEILEHYPNTGRGESCLVVGWNHQRPLHIVCGWRGERLVIITVYIPNQPHFSDPWTRQSNENTNNE
jgi:hypothetical protein